MRRGICLALCTSLVSCASISYEGVATPEYAAPAASTGPVAAFARAASAATGPAVAGFAARSISSGAEDSAWWLLRSSTSAFEARYALFDAAVDTLDVQYFIWQADPTGFVMLDRLLAAADRGVRVRLIVDDLSASGRDQEFYALAEHPNVQIRTFNPFRGRKSLTQAMEFSVRFGTLNHRMHNKAIISDGRVGIVGGRNIGDRYFGVFEEFVQHDLDIMFTGDIIDDVQGSFDEFWNAPKAVPVRSYLRPRRMKLDLEGLREMLSAAVRRGEPLFEPLHLDAQAWLSARVADAEHGPGEFVYDTADVDNLLRRRMKQDLYDFIAGANEEIVISVAYFIPDEQLSEILESAVRRGVRVVLLTNSVQSNNHMLAHVGYKRSRERVLASGIELYEFRPDGRFLQEQAVGTVTPGFVGLHTKAVVVDRRHVMVGTANFDPRALDINTESALMFENVAVAEELRGQILDAIQPENAWRLELDERGKVAWIGDDARRTSEPVRSLFQRFKMFLYVLIPLKNQA